MNRCVGVHTKAESNETVASFYSRLAKKKGNSKDIVAVSSKLLKIIYWVMN